MCCRCEQTTNVPEQIVGAHHVLVSSTPCSDDNFPSTLSKVRAATLWIESRARYAYQAVVTMRCVHVTDKGVESAAERIGRVMVGICRSVDFHDRSTYAK